MVTMAPPIIMTIRMVITTTVPTTIPMVPTPLTNRRFFVSSKPDLEISVRMTANKTPAKMAGFLIQAALCRGRVSQRQQHLRARDDAHDHRIGAAADLDLLLRQGIGRQAGCRTNLFRYDSLPSDALLHVLQPCRDIDRIPERSEHHVIAITDVTDDHFAAVNPDAEADRFAEIVFEKLIQISDVGIDRGCRLECLPAGGLPAGAKAEQRQLPVAEKLVGVNAAFAPGLR